MSLAKDSWEITKNYFFPLDVRKLTEGINEYKEKASVFDSAQYSLLESEINNYDAYYTQKLSKSVKRLMIVGGATITEHMLGNPTGDIGYWVEVVGCGLATTSVIRNASIGLRLSNLRSALKEVYVEKKEKLSEYFR